MYSSSSSLDPDAISMPDLQPVGLGTSASEGISVVFAELVGLPPVDTFGTVEEAPVGGGWDIVGGLPPRAASLTGGPDFGGGTTGAVGWRMFFLRISHTILRRK